MTSPQSTNTTPSTERKARAQLKHVLLDVGFKDKPVMINLESEFSPLARLLYMDLQAAMSAATNGLISRKVARVLGSRIGLEADYVDSILSFCLETKMLLLEDGMLTSARVIQDQEKLALEQERWRRKREKSEATSPVPAGVTEAKPRKCEDIEVLKIEDLNVLDLKKNSHPEKLEIPISNLDTPEVRKALALWEKHLAKLKKPLDQISLQAVLAQYSGRPGDLVDAIYHTTGNNWKTLIPKPTKEPKARGSPAERTFSTGKRMLEEELLKEKNNEKI